MRGAPRCKREHTFDVVKSNVSREWSESWDSTDGGLRTGHERRSERAVTVKFNQRYTILTLTAYPASAANLDGSKNVIFRGGLAFPA